MLESKRGFTLIELVIVILLIGIVAVYAAPKTGDLQAMSAAAFRDKLKADIRYAQNLAMAQSRRYRVYFNAAPAPSPNGYAVAFDTSNGAWSTFGYAQNPDSSGSLSIALNTGQYNGITVASTSNPLEFNSLGKPTGGSATVTVSPGGYTITITSETGLIN
jgi:MSHA pilin protein MshC